jgi:3-deoxy-7-phosphoheptulonate synthase
VNTAFTDSFDSLPLIIAGPCSVESELQIEITAKELSDQGIKFLRGGAFKPRTSPKSFQGLGAKGVELISKAAKKHEMFVVTELMDSNQLSKHYDDIDVIQIGSRNMSSFSFLKEVGKMTAKDQKPVLLKRGFSATITELLNAAQYIIQEGNKNVILCLRGIRTFEQIDSVFRFTPDLASIIELKERSNLRVIYDPSHASGNAKYVEKFSLAAMKLGADGLLIESHYKPEDAQSDKEQCILPSDVSRILSQI